MRRMRRITIRPQEEAAVSASAASVEMRGSEMSPFLSSKGGDGKDVQGGAAQWRNT